MILLALLLVNNANANQPTLITENLPPLNYLENNELKGPSIDIVREIKSRINIPDNITLYPWARGLRTMDRFANTALFSMAKTSERKNRYKWVGPIAKKVYVLLSNKKSKISISNIQQIPDFTVGVLLKGSHEEYLIDIGVSDLHRVNTHDQSIKMLTNDRIDLWCTSISTGKSTAKLNNISFEQFEIAYVLSETYLYITFNINTPDEVVNLWQQTLNNMHQEGMVEEIFRRHKLEYMYVPDMDPKHIKDFLLR